MKLTYQTCSSCSTSIEGTKTNLKETRQKIVKKKKKKETAFSKATI